MDVVRTAISFLGTEDPDEEVSTPEANYDKAVRMFAVLRPSSPRTCAAGAARTRSRPHHGLGYAENFLNMCFGEVPPDPVIVRAFEKSMVLYAEHSFNASTFAARVVTSTRSDIYSAVTAAIGALKGSLHGGGERGRHVRHDRHRPARPGEAVADRETRCQREGDGLRSPRLQER